MFQGKETRLPSRLTCIRIPGLATPLHLHLPPSVDVLLERLDLDAADVDERIPYWAEVWPSALGMAAWLASGRGPRRPGCTLEIGCGIGLLGLTALRLGWDCTLSDFDPDACAWSARNLRENHQNPERVIRLDWREASPARFDCIIASDVLYEKAFAEPLLAFLDSALTQRGVALIGEPLRPIADDTLALFATRFRVRSLPARSPDPDGRRPMRIIELRRSGSV